MHYRRTVDGGQKEGVGSIPGGDGLSLRVRAAEMFLGLLADSHLSAPDELAERFADRARVVGVKELVVYLVDYEQEILTPVPSPDAAERHSLALEGTVAGRAFMAGETLEVAGDRPTERRVWLPLLDGTDRLGAVEAVVGAGGGVARELVDVCERYVHLCAQLIIAKSAYGDVFELVRRRRPLSVAAEMQRKLLPPSVFATHGLIVAGLLEPAYEIGGDSFDYALNGSALHVAMFDAMGHGLAAAAAASVAVAAYRSARRQKMDLADTYAMVDEVLAGQFGEERYATAIFASLDITTGALVWLNAGHPPPLILRSGKLVKALATTPSPPVGMRLAAEGALAVGEESLEPGDTILFYTDGLTESRTEDGEKFDVGRLTTFIRDLSLGEVPPPEVLRRVRHAILHRQHVRLRDDASALLVEWRSEREKDLLPAGV